MTQPTTIQIDSVEYVRKDSIKPEIAKVKGTPIGQYCIIRCRDAGVWAGMVAAYEGSKVTVVDARRLYYWEAVKGHTLSAVANYGITGKSKIPAAVPTVYLSESCEVIPTSSEARDTIVNQKAHNE